MQPYLIPIQVAKPTAKARKMGLADEFVRLFGTIHAKPSGVRQVLQSLDARVECWFVEKPPQKRSTGLRKEWALDHGRLTATISGEPLTTVEHSAPELGRSASQRKTTTGGWGAMSLHADLGGDTIGVCD